MSSPLPFRLAFDDLQKLTHALQSILQSLSFGINIPGFYWEGEIPANSQVSIPNLMRAQVIPTGFLVTNIEGSNTIVRGDAEWSTSFVTLKNTSTTTAVKATVFFLK